jgi:hypothetical protein
MRRVAAARWSLVQQQQIGFYFAVELSLVVEPPIEEP